MIVEIRTYRIREGLLPDFLDLCEREGVPLQRSHGMRVIGPFIDLETPDTCVWLRMFPSLEERERMKRALYEGEKWLDHLEPVVMPMLESFTVVLAQAPAGFAPGPGADPADQSAAGRGAATP